MKKNLSWLKKSLMLSGLIFLGFAATLLAMENRIIFQPRQYPEGPWEQGRHDLKAEDVSFTTPDGLRLQHLSAGTRFTCGIDMADQLQCWGNGADRQTTPPPGTYVQVTAGEANACARRADGTVRCWGATSNNRSDPISGRPFTHINMGYLHGCGINSLGRGVCWGETGGSRTAVPE